MMHQMFTPLLGRPLEPALQDEWESGTAASHSLNPVTLQLHSEGSTSRAPFATMEGVASVNTITDGNPFELREPPALREASRRPLRFDDDESMSTIQLLNAPSLVIGGDSESDCASSRQSFVNDHGTFGVVQQDVLYVGSYRDACDTMNVDVVGIKAYLCVANDVQPPLPSHVSVRQLDRGDVAFLHLPLADSAATRLEDHFPAVFAFIDAQEAAGRPVAIYCQQGKSRSVSFALAYLMYKTQKCSECALQELRSTYKRADPNVFFLAQLAEWDARQNARLVR